MRIDISTRRSDNKSDSAAEHLTTQVTAPAYSSQPKDLNAGLPDFRDCSRGLARIGFFVLCLIALLMLGPFGTVDSWAQGTTYSGVISPTVASASRISEVGTAQPSITGGVAPWVLNSPCISGGSRCTSGVRVPKGTVLFACMWTFNRGLSYVPGCPYPSTDEPVRVTPPKGWVKIDKFEQEDPYGGPNNTLGGYDEFYAFYRVADGSETRHYIFTLSQCAEDQVGTVIAYRGVNTQLPLDPGGGHSFGHGNDSNPITIPGIVTRKRNDMLLTCLIDPFEANTFSTPSKFSQSWSIQTTRCCKSQGFDKIQSAPGPIGDINSTLSLTDPTGDDPSLIDNWFGELIALQPAGARSTSLP